MQLAPLSLLMACGGSIGSVEPPKLASAPDSLIVPCTRPVLLPNHMLLQSEAEAYWVRDRANLITCGERHQAQTEFYQFRDSEVTGNKID